MVDNQLDGTISFLNSVSDSNFEENHEIFMSCEIIIFIESFQRMAKRIFNDENSISYKNQNGKNIFRVSAQTFKDDIFHKINVFFYNFFNKKFPIERKVLL